MFAYRADGKSPVSREDGLEDINTQPRKTIMRVPKSQNCHRGMWERLIVPLSHRGRESET